MDMNQVTLPSTDVARSAAFYRAFGFTQIVSNLPSYARFECPVGTATFSLQQVASVPENSGVVVYFECVDLEYLPLPCWQRTPQSAVARSASGK